MYRNTGSSSGAHRSLPQPPNHFRNHWYIFHTHHSTIALAEDYSALHYAITRLRKLGNIAEALGELRMTSSHFWNLLGLRTE